MLYFSFLLVQVSHRDVGTVYPITSSMTSAMATGVLPTPMSVDDDTRSAVSLTDVRSWGDTLVYLENTVVPFLWVEEDAAPGLVMGVNQLLGGVRLQQWRLESVECMGAQLLKDTYSSFLSSRFGRSCRSTDSEYQTSNIVAPSDAQDGDTAVQGANADADTGAYTYWIPTGNSTAQALDHVQELRDSRWLSAAAESLTLQYAMYCGQIGWFALVQIDFWMDRVGAFTAVVSAKGLQTEVWNSATTILADLWFCLNIAWLLGGEVFGLRQAAADGQIFGYFAFHRVINWSLIFGGSVLIVFYMWLFVQIGDVGGELTGLLASDTGLTGEAASEHYAKLNRAYDSMDSLTSAVRWNEMSSFWYSMMMLAKIFQNFKANARLAVITKTLANASEDLFHFMLIFLLVFFNFIMGAHFLFGQALKEWSSAILAFCSGFRALMGDFDFAAMYWIAPFNATSWFVIYMGFVFLVLVNMFVAIVMDAYSTVKHEAGKTESIVNVVKKAAIRKSAFVMSKVSLRHSSDAFGTFKSSTTNRTVMVQEASTGDLEQKIKSLEGGVEMLDKLLGHHRRRGAPASTLLLPRFPASCLSAFSSPPSGRDLVLNIFSRKVGQHSSFQLFATLKASV
ncbi:unnamed protein product [Prorocentrum cordatum]|nr:unnamed protein product [Polarella glacialis]